jgi:hypothetical protein
MSAAGAKRATAKPHLGIIIHRGAKDERMSASALRSPEICQSALGQLRLFRSGWRRVRLGRFLPVGQRAEVNALIHGRAFRDELRPSKIIAKRRKICGPIRLSPNRGFVAMYPIASSETTSGVGRSGSLRRA